MRKKKTAEEWLLGLFGTAVMLFGLLGIAFGIVSILDPVGSKMSDDNDPLGVPPSLFESSVVTLVFLLITVLGLWLATDKSKRKAESDQR